MTEAIAIDGITGPGKHTKLVLGEVNELTFHFKKKTIGVITRDGNYGSYDLVQVTSIQLSGDGKNFNLMIESDEEVKEREREEAKKESDKQLKEIQDREKENDRIKAASRESSDKAGSKTATSGSQGPTNAASQGTVRKA